MSRNVLSKCIRVSSVLAIVLAISAVLAAPSFSEVIIASSELPGWTYLAGPPVTPLSAAPFTAADFAAALSGPPAVIVPPYGSFWLASLACNPKAKWISVDAARGPASTLFGRYFDVTTCCIHQAVLNFCWAADDYLGDNLAGGANPSGVYLNGVALPIDGGSYATESGVLLDVTGLVHCGLNELHVYDRDGAAVVSGTMFSAIIEITECPLKTESSTWGKIKSLYQ